MIPFWRLSEAGEDSLGLACSDDGLRLGRTPLIERRDERFAVRERGEIERLLKRAYGMEVAVNRIMPGLSTVAAALNADDQCLARIAAVHLRIPDLPDYRARSAMEADDILIKLIPARQGESTSEIQKASPDDPKHPGWPKGTEGGRGGEFRPKDEVGASIAEEARVRIERIAMRRALRTGALAVLRVAGESGATFTVHRFCSRRRNGSRRRSDDLRIQTTKDRCGGRNRFRQERTIWLGRPSS